MSTVRDLNTLILAGGNSTRMGSPKHLLPVRNEEPLLVHVLQAAQAAVGHSDASNTFVSFHNRNQSASLGTTLDSLARTLYDCDAPDHSNATESDIGPAAGLLRALDVNPDAYWLVVACDYPLLPTSALQYLQERFVEPVTSFKSLSGVCEPLLSIWSPAALRQLRTNVKAGYTGPANTVLQLQGTLIEPLDEMWLTNTNTPEQWAWARKIIQKPNTTTTYIS